MIIAKIKKLEFHTKPDVHTIAYYRVARKAAFDEPKDMTIRHVAAETLSEAVARLRGCVHEWLRQFVEIDLNPEDFTMEVWFTPVDSATGSFWNIYAHSGGTHTVWLSPSTP